MSAKKKNIFVTLVIFALLSIAAVFLVLFFWYQSSILSPSTDSAIKTVLIKKGLGADAISQKLFEEGVIKNPLAFRVYLSLNNLERSLPPGEFAIPTNLSAQEVVKLLQKGPQEVWVTLPEGLRREQVAERFIEALGHTGGNAEKFKKEFLNASKGLEGYLFPDTYLIPITFDATRSVALLKNTFDTKFGGAYQGDTALKDVVILASIIEREVRNNSERGKVAGVYVNRMRIGMPLQADATVQYALANIRCSLEKNPEGGCSDWWPTVYLADYKLVHPYSTYTNNGLPPGPIASPGLASLKAARNPEDVDFLYYIHDTSGRGYFANTLSEHNENIERYLR